MKKLLLIAFLVGSASAAMAQPGPGYDGRPGYGHDNRVADRHHRKHKVWVPRHREHGRMVPGHYVWR